MSNYFDFDPEMQDALQSDPELMRIAGMLRSAKSPEPPLDAEFRSRLRRQLMDQAWVSVEDKRPWWRGLAAPQRVAWAAAAAVVVIAASVVYYVSQPGGSNFTETLPKVSSSADGKPDVATVFSIPVKFSQPMDHQSTQNAVQITPATAVTYSWSGDQLLYVTPKSGNLAPNTQYQVTIGAGAKAQSGATTTQPQTVTFVTGVTANAGAPTPSPSPSPTTLLTNVHELSGDYPPSGTAYPVMWSADSSTVFFVGPNGALESVSIKDGTTKTIVPDGVSVPAMAPSGDRIAYVRGGHIEILDLASGVTHDVAIATTPTVLSWVHDRVYLAGSTGVYRLGGNGAVKLTDPPSPDATFVSIAPDGAHAIAQVGDGLVIVDTATGQSTNLCSGGCATKFQGWSPDGSRLIYDVNIADTKGAVVGSVPPGDASWSLAQQILIGSDTGIFEVLPQGGDPVKLSDGTFRQPVWAPDAATFAFVRGSQLWVASAPAPMVPPPAIDQALSVVRQFMQARLNGEQDHAANFLDANGKAAYTGTSLQLIPQGDPSLKRYFIVMSQVDPTTQAVHAVVRLVFAHGKVEQSSDDETLTLVRAQATDPYLIDGAAAGPQLQFGKGPQVISVKVTPTAVSVTFDSDLDATSVTNVVLQDSQGQPVAGQAGYDDRTVTFSNLQLAPGARYRLVVLPGIQDFNHQSPPSEYDLDFVGPASQDVTNPTPPPSSPTPAPAVTPSPSS
jgi:hypothetical protein